MITFVRDCWRVLSMACAEHTVLLSRQMDERLRPGEALGLALHIRVCAGCRAFRRQLRRIRDLGAMLGDEVDGGGGMPESARARLRARLGDAGQATQP